MVSKSLILFIVFLSYVGLAQEVKVINITIASEIKPSKEFSTLLIEVKGPFKVLSNAREMEIQFAGGGYGLHERTLYYNHSLGEGIIKCKIFVSDKKSLTELTNNLKKITLEVVLTE